MPQPATSTVPESPLPRRWVRALVAMTVLAALLYAAFAAFADVRAIQASVSAFRWGAAGLALALVALGYTFRIARWHLYLAHFGRPLSVTASSLTFLSGFAMGVTPGKAGEVIKAYYVRTHSGTDYAISVAAVIAERALDVLAVSLMLAAGWVLLPIQPVAAGFVLPIAVLLGLFVLRSEALVRAVTHLLGRIPLVRRSSRHVQSTHERLRPLLRGTLWAYGSALGILSWAFEPIAMWVLARGFGLDLSLAACALAFSAASLAGVLTFLPGGLGATEGSMVAILSLLGVALAPATALTLAIRLSTLWFGVFLGVLAIVALRMLPRPALATPRSDESVF